MKLLLWLARRMYWTLYGRSALVPVVVDGVLTKAVITPTLDFICDGETAFKCEEPTPEPPTADDVALDEAVLDLIAKLDEDCIHVQWDADTLEDVYISYRAKDVIRAALKRWAAR